MKRKRRWDGCPSRRRCDKRAQLTIKANNITFTGCYSFTPAPTATYIGLVNNDTPAAIPGITFSIQTIPLPNSPIRIPPKSPAKFGPGTYVIIVSGGFSADYQITYASGVLTVLQIEP